MNTDRSGLAGPVFSDYPCLPQTPLQHRLHRPRKPKASASSTLSRTTFPSAIPSRCIPRQEGILEAREGVVALGTRDTGYDGSYWLSTRHVLESPSRQTLECLLESLDEVTQDKKTHPKCELHHELG